MRRGAFAKQTCTFDRIEQKHQGDQNRQEDNYCLKIHFLVFIASKIYGLIF